MEKTAIPRGLTARISGFHPGGPGSTPGVGNLFCDFPCLTWALVGIDDTKHQQDEVAEWLRRWTANPMGSARVGSNPILVDTFYNSHCGQTKSLKNIPLPGIEPGPPG